jgi:hypothetical protein
MGQIFCRGEENFEELYAKGREAYLENNYKDCVEYMEAALRDYKSYNDIDDGCKRTCKQVSSYLPYKDCV